MLDRRRFVLLSGAGLLAACGGEPPPPPPGPATVNLRVSGEPGMNPGPDGSDRPVTVQVMRLRDLGAFNTADFFALQEDPSGALAADLAAMEQLAVPPGGAAATTLSVTPDAPFLALVALFRDPSGKVFRTAAPITPDANVTADVTLGPGGMAMTLS
jgi:type VI secretion system protein VasD